jgi:hypothetical protein
MLPLDLALAVAGRVANEVGRWVDDSDRARWSIVAGLVLLSAIPIAFVGSSPRPTDLTFDDVGQGHIPAMTTWVRLEGDLRATQNAGGTLYELHDSRDDARYVIVIAADGPLPTGHTMVTGRISPNITTTGNVGTIDADVPAVPPVDEPIWLYLTPGVIAIVIAIGVRTGYPVARRERGSGDHAPVLVGESLAARWNGRIGSDAVLRSRPEACTIEVSSEPGLSYLTLTTRAMTRTLRIRRPAYVERIRLCWVGRREPGVEVHGQNADLVLAFDDRAARDRLAATLRSG